MTEKNRRAIALSLIASVGIAGLAAFIRLWVLRQSLDEYIGPVVPGRYSSYQLQLLGFRDDFEVALTWMSAIVVLNLVSVLATVWLWPIRERELARKMVTETAAGPMKGRSRKGFGGS